MTETSSSELFIGLILSLEMSAMVQLGKLMHPATGKTERDLPQAKTTIDLLGAIEEKSRGNLSPDEARMLQRVLFELRMNYVEEVGKEEPGSRATPGPAPADSGASPEAAEQQRED